MNPDLQVKGTLAFGVILTHGAFEGVVAAGGKVNGALPQAHRLFHGHDLQPGNRGEAGFFVQARALSRR